MFNFLGSAQTTINDKLLDAVRAGKRDDVERLLGEGASPLSTYSASYNRSESRTKRNAAHYNAIQGDGKIADLIMRTKDGLTEHAEELAFSLDANKQFPVHLAAKHGHSPIVRLHLQYDDFDAHRLLEPDTSGKSPRELAQDAATKQVFAEHRPNNRVRYPVPKDLESMMSGGAPEVIFNGNAAQNFGLQMDNGRIILQSTKVFSAEQNGFIDNPEYERGIQSDAVQAR